MAGGIPSGSDPSGWDAGTVGSNPAQGYDATAAAGAVVGTGASLSGQLSGIAAGISSLVSRTQDTVTAAYSTQVQNDPTLTSYSDQVFEGLNPDGSTPLSTLLLQGLLNAFGGSSSTSTNSAVLAAIEASWSDIQQAWTQLQAFLETGDWSDLSAAFSDIYKAFFGSSTSTGSTASLAGPAVTNTAHTPQPVANFPNAASLVGVSYNGGGWEWDDSVSYTSDGVTSVGSAKCTANGALQAQNGVVTAVQPGQTVSLEPEVQWSGLSAASGTSPIQVLIVPWSGTTNPGTAGTPILLAEITSPGVSESSWTALTPVTNSGAGVNSGVYTVPGSGVGFVQARIVVTADATAGSVHWNACDTVISGGYISNIESLANQLTAESQASTAATQAFLQAIKAAVTQFGVDDNWTELAASLDSAYQTWASTESQLATSEFATLKQMLYALLGINTSTGQMSQTNIASSTGLASLENDVSNAVSSLSTDWTNLVAGAENTWNSLFGAAPTSGTQTIEQDVVNGLTNVWDWLTGTTTPTSSTQVQATAVSSSLGGGSTSLGADVSSVHTATAVAAAAATTAGTNASIAIASSQATKDAIVTATTGVPVTGSTDSQIVTGLTNFPATNIAGATGATVMFGASGGGNQAGGSSSTSSASWSHTILSTDLSVKAIVYHTRASGATYTSSCTYGGVAMTLISSVTSSAIGASVLTMEVWDLKAPPTGSQTVLASVSAGGGLAAYIGGDSLSYLASKIITCSPSTGGNNANPSMSASSATGRMVIGAFAFIAGTTPTLTSYSQTQRANLASSAGVSIVLGDVAGASSVSFGVHCAAATNQWVGMTIDLSN